MTNIATMAYKQVKPNKITAAELIKAAYKGQQLTQEQLAALYKYFLPAVSSKPASYPFQWVSKAATKKHSRTCLHHAYSDGENLVALDGYRLHYVEKPGLPEGFYSPQGEKLDANFGPFPDYKRILPETDLDSVVTLSKLDIETKEMRKKLVPHYVINGVLFNKKYLDEFANGDESIRTATPKNDATAMRVQSVCGARNGVIMPVRT